MLASIYSSILSALNILGLLKRKVTDVLSNGRGSIKATGLFVACTLKLKVEVFPAISFTNKVIEWIALSLKKIIPLFIRCE